MTIQHRRIPVLPELSSVHPIAGQIYRSYPVGRQSFSCAFQGEVLSLIISREDPFPDNIQADLVTTLNSERGCTSVKVPFVRADMRTLVCNIIPKYPGLHPFRAVFSLDSGVTWLPDTVHDAWVLIDTPHIGSGFLQ
jgi:hypothetical protein